VLSTVLGAVLGTVLGMPRRTRHHTVSTAH
jgi:hypothetical protein